MESRVLRFPSDASIGMLSFRTSGSGENWVECSEARGEVVVPAGKEIQLTVSATAMFDPNIFSHLEPAALSVFAWFSTSNVTDAAIEQIRHLTGLQGLVLWETGITDEVLWLLRHLPNLRWLDIGDTRITDDGLAYISEFGSLKELVLLNDKVTDKGLAHLQKLPAIRYLDLMNTVITDAGINALCKLTSLKYLRIFGTGITGKGYGDLAKALPRCQIKFYHPHHV